MCENVACSNCTDNTVRSVSHSLSIMYFLFQVGCGYSRCSTVYDIHNKVIGTYDTNTPCLPARLRLQVSWYVLLYMYYTCTCTCTWARLIIQRFKLQSKLFHLFALKLC